MTKHGVWQGAWNGPTSGRQYGGNAGVVRSFLKARLHDVGSRCKLAGGPFCLPTGSNHDNVARV